MGVGRGTPASQVNYHQHPSRNNSTQNRNTGYNSAQQGNFNSSSQPAFTTQSGYNTGSTVPATQTKAAQPQAQPPAQSPAQPQQQPQPQTKPPAPTTPILKQEPVTPANTPKVDNAENGEEAAPTPKQPFWKKKPFVKLSNKVKRARQNAKLRRVLNPKNALTFLNELRPGGIKFVVREEAGWGYVASVDVDGKTFSGHALTVSKAKVQASEQALKHLLLEQLCKSQSAPSTSEKEEIKDEGEEMETEESNEGGEPKPKKAKSELVEDELPWGSLAAFALHKLFAEWQKEGTELPPQGHVQEKYEEGLEIDEPYFARRPPGPPDFGYPRRFAPAGPFGRGRGFPPYPPRGPPPPGFGIPRRPPPAAFPSPVPRPALPLGVGPLNIMPMKKIPEDASKRHPVMLLNQLKPNLIYQEFREGDPPNVFFRITVEIEGKEYPGRGKSKKEAKKNAAKAALAPLGIIYQEDE